MTINQTFGEWELITDEPGDEIYWEHLPSGTRMEFHPDGTMASPAVQTDELSVGATGPVSGLVGDSGDYELLTSYPIGTLSPSTTSTSYTQPYLNEERMVVPLEDINITGYESLSVSITGRFNSTSNDGVVASLRIVDDDGNTGAETTSSPDPEFEKFSTSRFEIEQGGLQFIDYEVKSSNGSEIDVYGVSTLHLWGLIA
jgi:hypothetical protein